MVSLRSLRNGNWKSRRILKTEESKEKVKQFAEEWKEREQNVFTRMAFEICFSGVEKMIRRGMEGNQKEHLESAAKVQI